MRLEMRLEKDAANTQGKLGMEPSPANEGRMRTTATSGRDKGGFKVGIRTRPNDKPYTESKGLMGIQQAGLPLQIRGNNPIRPSQTPRQHFQSFGSIPARDPNARSSRMAMNRDETKET